MYHSNLKKKTTRRTINIVLTPQHKPNRRVRYWTRLTKRHSNLFTTDYHLLDLTRNVMAHAKKPELGFLRNGRVHLNRRGGSVQSTARSRGVRISGSNGSNAGYTVFWGRVQDCWLRTPLACFPFTSPPVCHQIPRALYLSCTRQVWTALNVFETPERVQLTHSSTWKRSKGLRPNDTAQELHLKVIINQDVRMYCTSIYVLRWILT